MLCRVIILCFVMLCYVCMYVCVRVYVSNVCMRVCVCMYMYVCMYTLSVTQRRSYNSLSDTPFIFHLLTFIILLSFSLWLLRSGLSLLVRGDLTKSDFLLENKKGNSLE